MPEPPRDTSRDARPRPRWCATSTSKYTDEFEPWWIASPSGAMKHRPNDWSPQRKTRLATMTAQLLDKLQTEEARARPRPSAVKRITQPAAGAARGHPRADGPSSTSARQFRASRISGTGETNHASSTHHPCTGQPPPPRRPRPPPARRPGAAPDLIVATWGNLPMSSFTDLKTATRIVSCD